jgi:hypothetical protein
LSRQKSKWLGAVHSVELKGERVVGFLDEAANPEWPRQHGINPLAHRVSSSLLLCPVEVEQLKPRGLKASCHHKRKSLKQLVAKVVILFAF